MFYAKLNHLCTKKGMSVSRLAQELNLSKATASKWKHGAKPFYNTLLRIANYFDVDVEYLADDRYLDYDEWLMEVKGMTRAEVIRPTNWTEEKTTIADGLDEEFLAMAKQLNASQLQRVKDFIRGMLS